MMDKDLAEQLEHSSSEWIYILTWNNLLKQLFTPFEVEVIRSVGDLEIGQIVWVSQVKVTPQLKTVYIIEGKAYYFFHFDIIVD
tara:strand:+ start:558 stop:809 length:252 start_codon:yes stop_codon:yes gene_type:complete